MKKHLYLLLYAIGITLCSVSIVAAQGRQIDCPPYKSYQDCPGAIPLCSIANSFTDDSLCGEGDLVDEVIGSCGTQERISTWYQFKARRPGKLRFRIIPNDVTGAALTDYDATTGQGDTDYDFVLFKLPAGTDVANTTVCNLIGENPRANRYEVACNYSGARGVTGVYDSLNADLSGRFDTPLQVQTGDFFILLVDNFTVTQVGYTILFDDPDHYSTSTDVRVAADSAKFSQVLSTPNCNSNALRFSFDKAVLCSSISGFTFGVKSDAHPEVVVQIDSILGRDCGRSGGGGDIPASSQQWTVFFSPVNIDSTYYLYLNQAITDICGNITTHDTIRFKVDHYLDLNSFVGRNLQDAVCSGDTIRLVATLDPVIKARSSDFNYAFFVETAGGARIPLPNPSDGSFILRGDTSIFTSQNVSLPTSYRFTVATNSSRFAGCQDTATHTITINPPVQGTFDDIPPLCFGEFHQIQINGDIDTSKYHYAWYSSVAQDTISNSGFLKVTADTVDEVSADSMEVLRKTNDRLTLYQRYKAEFGGCKADTLSHVVRVGAYLAANFTYETIDRPGKTTKTYVTPVRVFTDGSVAVPERPNGRQLFNQWTIDFAPGAGAQSQIYTTSSVKDSSIAYDFTTANGEGNYTVTQILRDTIADGKVCESRYSTQFEDVNPVVPTVVTANGDGLNDYFEIPGLKKSANYQLVVMNRWGRKVYEQGNYDNTFNGNNLPDGIYFYNLAPSTGDSPSYRGWLELNNKK